MSGSTQGCTTAILLLILGVAMVQNPDWWIRQLEIISEHLDAEMRNFQYPRWQRPREGRWRARVGTVNQRRARAAMRWTGVLFALLASANLYELALRMLAR